MALDLKRVASSAIEAAFDQSSPQASPRRRHPVLKTVALGAGFAAAARFAARRGPDLWQTVATEYTRLRDEIDDPPDGDVEYDDELDDEDEDLDDEDLEDEDLEDEEDLEEATR
jgi:hypothetical protein